MATDSAKSARAPSGAWIDLAPYTVGDYSPGRGKLVQLFWWYTSLVFFESGWFPFVGFKPSLLRLFGAKIGEGVVFKPHVRIKHPWRLEIGDHTWIGQDVWIDNLADVRIGSHACVSQGAYFCTGNHDHRSAGFDLIPEEITVGDGAWVAARCLLVAGVRVGANALAAAGSVVTRDVPPGVIVAGTPARPVGERTPPGE